MLQPHAFYDAKILTDFCKRYQQELKTGMFNMRTQKHLHILSETTAIEYSNQLIQSVLQ